MVFVLLRGQTMVGGRSTVDLMVEVRSFFRQYCAPVAFYAVPPRLQPATMLRRSGLGADGMVSMSNRDSSVPGNDDGVKVGCCVPPTKTGSTATF